MLRCSRCNNQYAISIMYKDLNGKDVCIHCLESDEEATEAKTMEVINAELVAAIKKAMDHISFALEPRVVLSADKPLNCAENHEAVRAAVNCFLRCAEFELRRVING